MECRVGAFHVFQADKGALARQLDEVVNADDVVVAELATLLYLALEVQQGDRVVGDITAQHLDGNELIKLGVLSQPNLSHGAPAQFLDQLIAPRANLDSRRQVTGPFQLQVNVQVAHLQALVGVQA